jgi:hypothetical protein
MPRRGKGAGGKARVRWLRSAPSGGPGCLPLSPSGEVSNFAQIVRRDRPMNFDSDGPPHPAPPRIQLVVITQQPAGRSIYQVQPTASQTGDGVIGFAFAHRRIVGKPALDAQPSCRTSKHNRSHLLPSAAAISASDRENARNSPARIPQTKTIRLPAGVALGYFLRPPLCASNHRVFARQNRRLRIDRNASPKPINCEHILLPSRRSYRSTATAAAYRSGASFSTPHQYHSYSNSQLFALPTFPHLGAEIACIGQGMPKRFRRLRILPGHHPSYPDRRRRGTRNWGRPSRPPFDVHLHDVA